MLRFLASAIAGSVLIGGCASVGSGNVDPGYQPTANGLLVASLTASGYNPGRLSYQVVQVAGSKQAVASISVNQEMPELDWRPGDPAVRNGGYGRLAVVELAPGEYELSRGFIHVSAQDVYSSSRPFGYRFTILPGKAVYLGNVHTDIELSESRKLAPSTLLLNRRERDLPVLHRKYANLKADQIVFPDELERERMLRRSAEDSPTKLEDLQGLLPRKSKP